MKKTLRKLSLSRETVRTLERLPLFVNGAQPAYSGSVNTCPELCDPIRRLTDIC
jgi:hypothetical protein